MQHRLQVNPAGYRSRSLAPSPAHMGATDDRPVLQQRRLLTNQKHSGAARQTQAEPLLLPQRCPILLCRTRFSPNETASSRIYPGILSNRRLPYYNVIFRLCDSTTPFTRYSPSNPLKSQQFRSPDPLPGFDQCLRRWTRRISGLHPPGSIGFWRPAINSSRSFCSLLEPLYFLSLFSGSIFCPERFITSFFHLDSRRSQLPFGSLSIP